MNIVIINKSDSTGGAAVVSRRLMEALRAEGEDARMLVVEKLTDSPYVEVAASPRRSMIPFIWERLKIFIANGFDRRSLFKIDTASDGLPLWNNPLVKNADAILLNWVNQGMLSLKGVEEILRLGKPVIWTMHDMWCMTGICHHAGKCDGFKGECGECPLLKSSDSNDLSHKIWKRKRKVYWGKNKITFVAVSNWLAAKAVESSLLGDQKVIVIPNAFDLGSVSEDLPRLDNESRTLTLLFGAARLDDDIKGFPVLIEMTKILNEDYPELAKILQLVTFGGIKNPDLIDEIAMPHHHLGMVKGEDKIREIYDNGDILISASSYETLPGTLVEAQAYGCIPVSFNQGGQSDIVDHLSTGYIAEYSGDKKEAARRLAEGVAWAAEIAGNPERFGEMKKKMRGNIESRFAAHVIADCYLQLLR